MKKLIIAGFIVFMALSVDAQRYDAAVGIRASPSPGISAKIGMMDDNVVELIFHRRNATRYRFTTLYERHTHIQNNLWWYGGFGGTINYITDDIVKDKFGLGVDAVIGLEWTADFFPLSLSFDYKPGLNLFGAGQGRSFFWDEPGFSIRYLIGYNNQLSPIRFVPTRSLEVFLECFQLKIQGLPVSQISNSRTP